MIFAISIIAFAICAFAQDVSFDPKQLCDDPFDQYHSSVSLFNSKITLLTYATANIHSYAKYSSSINKMYAIMHKYSFLTFSPATGSEHDKMDQRWNRVKILLDLLSADPNGSEYFVWMDADLIVADFSLRLEDVILQHSSADVIISSEFHAETGVANTGCFIVRNSQWSRDFLQRWWNSERSYAHDQILFDRLYRSLLPGVTDRIAVLPTTALNSVPPAYTGSEQHPHYHHMLHLMGESDELRAEVFKRALAKMCEQLSGGRSVEQVLMAPSHLTLVACTVHSGRIAALLTTIYAANARCGDVDVDSFKHAASELRELLLLAAKLNCSAPHDTDLVHALSAAYQQSRAVLSLLTSTGCETVCAAHSISVAVAVAVAVEVASLCATLGNDLLLQLSASGADPAIQSALFGEVDAQLGLLASSVAQSSLPAVLEMQVMLLTNWGQFLLSLGRHREALTKLRTAAHLLRGGKGLALWTPNPHQSVHPLRSLARAMCVSGHVAEAAAQYREVLGLLEGLLAAEQQVKSDHHLYLEVAQEALSCVDNTDTWLCGSLREKLGRLAERFGDESEQSRSFTLRVVALLDSLDISKVCGGGVARSAAKNSTATVKRMKKRRKVQIL